jgi:hypothetical protein
MRDAQRVVHRALEQPASLVGWQNSLISLLNGLIAHKEGVKTRVLMLSATPVNNRLADLKLVLDSIQ